MDGPRAFCYYLPAALACVLFADAAIGAVELGALLADIEFHMDPDKTAIAAVLPVLGEAIGEIVASFARLDDDPVELERWIALRARLGDGG